MEFYSLWNNMEDYLKVLQYSLPYVYISLKYDIADFPIMMWNHSPTYLLIWGLLWSVECSRSDIVPILRINIKQPGILSLIIQIFCAGEFIYKSAHLPAYWRSMSECNVDQKKCPADCRLKALSFGMVGYVAINSPYTEHMENAC